MTNKFQIPKFKILIFGVSLFALFGFAKAASAATYYASPSGSGATCSQASSCTVAGGIAKLVAGDTLYLLDGTYIGANSMIAPPSGRSGTSDRPIAVRAVNDGAVLIDGENVPGRIPIHLNANDYWDIEGINAKRSYTEGVVVLENGSDNNIFRRVVAWDANPNANTHVWSIFAQSSYNLFEDIAGFGKGRKIMQFNDHADHNRIRRAWGMYNQYNYNPGYEMPQMTFALAYNTYDNQCENCIGTMNIDSAQTYNNIIGIFTNDRMNYVSDLCSQSGYHYSIAYTLSGYRTGMLGALVNGGGWDGVNCFTFDNVAVYMETSTSPDKTAQLNSAGVGSTYLINNSTEIRTGGVSRELADQWVESRNVQSTTVAGAPNLWDGAGSAGARICYRYVNGALTSTPLWPWPMNLRIIDAMIQSGRTPVDVTATIESMFGLIPSQCKAGATAPPLPTADLNSDGRVNSVDAAILMGAWGQTAKPKADINQDGIVNSVDASLMMGQWSL